MSRKVKSSGYSKTNDDSSDELPYKDHKNRNRSKHKHRSDSAERTYDDYAESGREKSSRDRSRWEEKKSYHRDNNRDREQTTSKYQDDRREDQNRSRQSDRPGSSIQQQYRRDAQPSGSRDSQGGRDNYRRRSRSPFKPPTDRRPPSAPNQDRRDRPKMGRASIKEEKNKSDGEGNDLQWGKRRDDKVKQEQQDEDAPPVEKQKPDFGLSGKLTEETNKVNGVVIAYSEPPGARKPKRRWRLYPFKGEQALPTLYIHRQSCYLIGRDRKVCDLPVDHPSCSKQHAVLQYRLVPYERVDGTKSQRVRPYLIDLDSSNGTFVNNKKIDPKRYYELHEKDVLKFAFSSREYVLLHENSKEDNEEDEGLDASPAGKDRPAGVSVKEEEK